MSLPPPSNPAVKETLVKNPEKDFDVDTRYILYATVHILYPISRLSGKSLIQMPTCRNSVIAPIGMVAFYVYALLVAKFWETMAQQGKGENRRYYNTPRGTFKVRKLDNIQQQQQSEWTDI
eukprot:scaffold84795_cov56-Attheya_sp.AAC.2